MTKRSHHRALTTYGRLKLRMYRIACGLWTGLVRPPSANTQPTEHGERDLRPTRYPKT